MRRTVRHIIGILTLLTVLPVHHSCTEEVPKVLDNTVFTVEPASLILSKNELRFTTYQKSSLTVSVLSTNIDWEFTDIPDWISITPSSGTGDGSTIVSITCEANPDVRDRVGVLVFRSRNDEWNYSTPVTVSQVRSVYKAIPDKDTVQFPCNASQAIIEVNANNDEWTVRVLDDLSSWCSVRKNQGTIEIDCSNNSSPESRSGQFVVETPDGTYTVNVEQEGLEMDVRVANSDSIALNFSAKAGTSQLFINTLPKVEWTVTTFEEWITLSPTHGTGSGVISVSVGENDEGPVRKGTVRIQAFDYVQDVAVFQDGKYMEVTSPSLSFGSKGGEVMLSLKSNDGWSASADCDWITLSQTQGDDDCNILLTVADNNSIVSRSGTVTITPKVALPVVLNVEQAGRYLTLSDSSIVFGHGGVAQKTVLVSTDGDFDVTTDCNYIAIDKQDGRFTLSIVDFDASTAIKDTVSVYLTNLPAGISLVRKIAIVLYGINREVVDLGLSVKWAACNVGALQSWEYGDYYAWGELEPFYESGSAQSDNPIWRSGKDSGYDWASYTYCNGTSTSFTKYCQKTGLGFNGYMDDKRILEPEDDLAHMEWGDGWRMPTIDEINELIEYCIWSWETKDGVNGYRVSSNVPGYEGRSIFLPAAGYRSGTDLGRLGSIGKYWSSTIGNTENAQILSIGSDNRSIEKETRMVGCLVRPVSMYQESELTDLQLDNIKLKLAVGSYYSLNVSAQKQDGHTVVCKGAQWSTGDSAVAVVSADGTVRAVGAGTCVITVSYGSLKDECTVTVIDPINVTPEAVDLGLSVKWATFNIGACSPEIFGDYYAWGETAPYYESGYAQSANPVWKSGKTDGYAWTSYKYGLYSELTKYCNKENYGRNGYVDEKTVLERLDDVAYMRWGTDWRMPTSAEFEELLNNCQIEWAAQDGVKGYRLTSRKAGFTGRSIFLPTSGRRFDTSLDEVGNVGSYWSGSLDPEQPYAALAYNVYESFIKQDNNYTSVLRSNGCAVRPVQPYTIDDVDSISISPSQLNIVLDADQKLTVTGYVRDVSTFTITQAKWTSDNVQVATVKNGIVTAVGSGTCTITATFGNDPNTAVTAVCTVVVTDPRSVAAEPVDLGLSVKWASFNIGATSPEGYGDYFAWGETETYYKYGYAQSANPVWRSGKSGGYSWSSYKYGTNLYNLTKYNSTDGKKVLDPYDDAAHELWGDDWRMPTMAEIDELVAGCTWVWTTQNGVTGYLVISNVTGFTDQSIFMPAGGRYENNSIYNLGQEGFYWSSTSEDNYALMVNFIQPFPGYAQYFRYEGASIRPVCQLDESCLSKIELNYSEKKMALNDMFDLKIIGYRKTGNTLSLNGAQWTTSDNNVVQVSGGTVKAVGAGECTVTAIYGSFTAECTITVIDPSTVTPEYVDMGLSVKWATFNVGAYSPESYGDYYAWGETEPYYMQGYAQSEKPVWKTGKYSSYGYSWNSYRYSNESSSSLTKYCYNAAYGNKGYTDNKTVLDPEDDVAHVKWGGNWRIPTSSEFQELSNNCTWTWAILDGVKGCRVTSNIEGYTDRSIFLPAAGMRTYTGRYEAETRGYYYSSTLYDGNNPSYVYAIEFSSSGDHWNTYYERDYGIPIRPVCDFSASEFSKIELNNQELSLIQGSRSRLQVTGYKISGETIILNNVEWSLSNDTVISIDNSGKIRALKAGICYVTATYGTHTDECEVIVTAHPANMNDVMLTDNFYLLVNDYPDGERLERVEPRLVQDPDDDENMCVAVTTNQNLEHEYDAQLFIVFNDDLGLYSSVEITFSRKALQPQKSSTELHSTPGEWISMNPISYVQFTTEWTPFSYTYHITDVNAGAIVIDLSYLQDGNVCYFDDFSVTYVP